MSKTVQFQTIQFSISTHFSSIKPIDRALSGATTPGQRGLESNGNEGVLRIPQSSSITGSSPLDYLVSYPLVEGLPLCREKVGVFNSPNRLGHSLERESYPWAEMQSMYSTAPTDWATRWRGSLTLGQRCSRCILQPQPTGPLVGEGVLPLGRDAVDVFYSPNQLGHSLERGSYPWAGMQSVYTTALVDGTDNLRSR